MGHYDHAIDDCYDDPDPPEQYLPEPHLPDHHTLPGADADYDDPSHAHLRAVTAPDMTGQGFTPPIRGPADRAGHDQRSLRRDRAADWLTDVVPHLAYGVVTAAVINTLDRVG